MILHPRSSWDNIDSGVLRLRGVIKLWVGVDNKGVFFPQFWCCVGSNLVKLGHIRAKKIKILVWAP